MNLYHINTWFFAFLEAVTRHVKIFSWDQTSTLNGMRSYKCKIPTLKSCWQWCIVIKNALILNIIHNVSNYARTRYCLVMIIPTSYQKLIHLQCGPEVTCFKVKLSYVLIISEDLRFQKKMFILSSVTCLFYLTRKYNTKYGKHW